MPRSSAPTPAILTSFANIKRYSPRYLPPLPSCRPGQRIRLDVGVAFHRLPNAFLVAKARILDASKGTHLDTVARHFPDIDGAHLQLVDEARDVIEPVRAHARGQPVSRS